jgi:hypothetical protein
MNYLNLFKLWYVVKSKYFYSIKKLKEKYIEFFYSI